MKTILDYAKEKKIILNASCNGTKQCGQCKVKIGSRESKISKEEKELLSQKDLLNGIRLACCQEYNEKDQYEFVSLKMGIEENTKILTEYHPHYQKGIGVAVDIGTTTVVMKWINLQNGKTIDTISFYNPQASYGSDVIARIQYDSQDEHHQLHKLIINEIEKNLQVNNQFSIKQMVMSANTTMTHLFLGLPVESLGKSPFTIPHPQIKKMMSKEIFPNIQEEFEIITLPHIAAFVGGDVVSGIVACGIDQKEERSLFVDLGTNGEIVVGNRKEIYATSTAAGPAFEGAGIVCGGPSVAGAITKVMITEKEILCETMDNQPAKWLCGSGLISLISELVRKGYIDEMGNFIDQTQVFHITKDIYITKKDIKSFQLAKAAVQTGINIITKDQRIDHIYISGGLGSHIEIDDLITLKMIPEAYKDIVTIVSNSSLSGAVVALLMNDLSRFEKISKQTRHFNLASHIDFEEQLLDNLYF